MYDIKLTDSATTDLSSISHSDANRVADKIEWLGNNFEETPHFRLHGKEWKDCFKFRVGDYRIVYTIDHSHRLIIIQRIQHRKEVYKDKN